MTTLRYIAALLVSLCFISSASFAEDYAKGTVYYGGNLGFLDYAEEGRTLSTKAVYARYGRYFNKYFSAEGRIALRLGNDSYEETNESFTQEVDVELDYIYGVFGRAEIAVSQSTQFYVLLGYAQTRNTASVDGGASFSNTESSAASGAGFTFGASDSTQFNIEYTKYLDVDGITLDGLAIGFVNYF